MTDYEEDLYRRCEADHPDHQYLFELHGVPYLWTVWCCICDGKGYNSDTRYNQINPDMSAHYVEAVTAAACLVNKEQARQTALRKAKRAAKK
jgi:hypothetical protein